MPTLDVCLYDTKIRGKLILALQRAISKQFSETDWTDFGYSSGQHDYIRGHSRLLRSLHFGDEDYGSCVFQILEHLADYDHDAIKQLIDQPKVRRQLNKDSPDILALLGVDIEQVKTDVLPVVSSADVVLRALADAEHLLHANGPVSAVDRLHTALHGYFRSLCADSSIEASKDASITALFKALRTDHPSLQFLGEHDKDMVRVLNGFANALDALNSVRNNASVAHPNENLLDEPEAMLALNATRTVFNYVRTKVS
ncbi:abortive infection family protein [Aquitalea aquatilis]|uniref:abortive infection family protein n=1 Tax=Aquitalea aquatilis TaxID=1537400 RepID=UPI0010BDB8BD|nr:abortive infection family protein [Aquitalea aquatilis]